MRITYDENKRRKVLAERGLDFDDAAPLFENFHLTRRDERSRDEERFQTVGELKGQVVLVIWTLREESRRIITMWKLDHGESERYYRRRDECR
jgi:uncharacterized DUF497 family protein